MLSSGLEKSLKVRFGVLAQRIPASRRDNFGRAGEFKLEGHILSLVYHHTPQDEPRAVQIQDTYDVHITGQRQNLVAGMEY